ncbi:MAG: hypothetical protein SGJ13_04155 [Actinomycetota bacterium]|nr:hypothetical protein [Actinomycetota bacterium]
MTFPISVVDAFTSRAFAGIRRRHVFVAVVHAERGGVLRVRLDGERVRIAGHAVTVLEGSLPA